MGEYEFRTDPSRNRFYARLSGFFRESETQEMYEAVERELDTLRSGFDVVLDIRGLKAGSPAAVVWLERAAALFKERGRRRGVHISGALVTALLQFKRVLGGLFAEDTTRTARSLEEADHMLDEWDKRPRSEG